MAFYEYSLQLLHGARSLPESVETANQVRWDIFCRVVDNFGDIGVTWRLARQLASEHKVTVRLWVDDLQAFARVCPGADPTAQQQWQTDVLVCRWNVEWQATSGADMVIEAFACGLPQAYIDAMAAQLRPCLWVNLEYLSAEAWVDGCHGLPSPQPQGLRKLFFFPGFTAATGGLLRERDLLDRRIAWQAQPAAKIEFLHALGVQPQPDARLISLFAYRQPGLGSWLNALAAATQPTLLLVPEGLILGDVQTWLAACGEDGELQIGNPAQIGALTVHVLPFVSQDDYDRLLWSCDFNVVRGEDSFVRAQWAGKPFLWHIYVQEEGAHLEKLDAFLARYTVGLSASAEQTLRQLWVSWNRHLSLDAAWTQFLEGWPEQSAHAQDWSATAAERVDLASALVQLYLNWI